VPSSTGLDRFAVKGKSKGKQSKKCRPFPLNGDFGRFSEKKQDLKNTKIQLIQYKKKGFQTFLFEILTSVRRLPFGYFSKSILDNRISRPAPPRA
jgi:hypothetical protein